MIRMEVGSLRIDGGTQPRVAIDEAVVAEYAGILEEGGSLPPVVAFHDGAQYWLADGFHRWHAYRRTSPDSIPVEVHEGGRREAVLYSVGANAAHGLRRTAADKRKAVETMLADPEWVKWSDRHIAKACAVSHTFVTGIRTSLASVASEKPSDRLYVTKHGTVSTMDTSGIDKSGAGGRATAAKRNAQRNAQRDAQRDAQPDAREDEAKQARDEVSTQEVMEDMDRENRQLREQLAALQADDIKAELAKQIKLRQATESRLGQEIDATSRLEKQLRKFGEHFAKLRKITGAKGNAEVVTIVEKRFAR